MTTETLTIGSTFAPVHTIDDAHRLGAAAITDECLQVGKLRLARFRADELDDETIVYDLFSVMLAVLIYQGKVKVVND